MYLSFCEFQSFGTFKVAVWRCGSALVFDQCS